ncbi:serine hydrolase YJU3 [Kluyveromyces marxianus DMKU3-1042]|uniref:Serine hydrolase YJU3 n=1 Tax=Kluyveromyces marxianus (strain DMKU3-1042 / BCC 29191 / NBRC 104275) TaxID=1003335 RepID=W0TDJ9_KLUMD|nr:serine hydrolase YJU3 [Kluyveromyces marxianus DMKU3-1042]BAO40871.1 serine hydrolase YJU3 [Kluyveromyces marxianus DMKU3-1042]
MTSLAYEKNIKTEIPVVQKEKFNGADFTYLKWPASSTNSNGSDDTTTTTKCRVIIVHGFCEYYKLYYKLMDRLAQNGVESFIFDQRGAGETSPGKEKGNTDETRTFQDLDHFIEKNLKECEALGNRKLFLFGHSMGGGIVLNYGCSGKYRSKIAGIMTTGPLIELHPKSNPMYIVRKLSPVLAAVLPNFKIDTSLNVEGITGSKENQELLKKDPNLKLVGSFRQIYDMLERGKRLLSDPVRAEGFRTPVLIMHGEQDTINDPKASEKFIRDRLPHLQDKTLKIYHDARHSLLSLERDEYFDQAFGDMIQWIDVHTITE